MLPSMTAVEARSTMEECGLPLKSTETSSSSVASRMPCKGPLAAARKASLTAWALAGFSSSAVRSTTETLAVGTRMASPSSLPLSSGEHEPHRGGRARGRRDHAHRAGARPAEVLVREIVDGLVIGVGMHGGGEAPLDAEIVEQDLGHGGEAIGRAGGIRHELMAGGVVLLLVDPQDDGDIRVLGGRRDHHLLGPGLQVLGRGRLVPEDSR